MLKQNMKHEACQPTALKQWNTVIHQINVLGAEAENEPYYLPDFNKTWDIRNTLLIPDKTNNLWTPEYLLIIEYLEKSPFMSLNSLVPPIIMPN